MNSYVQFKDLSEEAKEVALNEVVKKFKTNGSIQKKIEKMVEKDLKAAMNVLHVTAEKFYIDFQKNKLVGFQNAQLLPTALPLWLSDQEMLEWNKMMERKSPTTLDLYIRQTNGTLYCEIEVDLTPKEDVTQREVLDVLQITNQKKYHHRRLRALGENFKLTPEIYKDFEDSIKDSLKKIKKTIDTELREIRNNVQGVLNEYFSDEESTKDYLETPLLSGELTLLFNQNGTLF